MSGTQKELKKTSRIRADIRAAVRELERREDAAKVALFQILQARITGHVDELCEEFWEETLELLDAMRQ